MSANTRTRIIQVAPAALDRESAAEYLALSVSTFESLVRERDVPQPRQLAGRRVAWLRVELDAWLETRPVSEQLPPENTSAAKPRGRRRAAANDPAMPPAAQAGQRVA